MNASYDEKAIESASLSTARALDRMPMVRKLVENLQSSGFCFGDNVLLFGVQHIMDQALVLCWALNALGVSYDRIALCGKIYSFCPDTARELVALGVLIQPVKPFSPLSSQTENLVDDIRHLGQVFAQKKTKLVNPIILVLDDGGHALTNIFNILQQPFEISGVEQTASGFWQTGIRSVPMQITDVGSSAVKRLCEPAIIIDAALQRVHHLLRQETGRPTIGIIGLGYIGEALAHSLKKDGYELCAFDVRRDVQKELSGILMSSAYDVINESDIIFGCSGADITADLDDNINIFGIKKKNRKVISISSGDDEFYTLKSKILSGKTSIDNYHVGNISDISGIYRGSQFTIFRNGFPINFDNGRESVSLELIQGTICALIAALCQGYLSMQRKRYTNQLAERLMLDIHFQRWLLSQWQHILPSVLTPSDANGTALKLEELKDISEARTNPVSIQGPSIFGPWTNEECESPQNSR